MDLLLNSKEKMAQVSISGTKMGKSEHLIHNLSNQRMLPIICEFHGSTTLHWCGLGTKR